MTITQIAILAFVAIPLGWLTRKWQRVNLLLIISILIIFWLQPALPLRYLDFFLPTLSIGLTVLTWALTASPEVRHQKESKTSAVITLCVIFFLATTRYLNFDNFLTPTRPPPIGQVLFLLAIFVVGTFLLARQKSSSSNTLLWAGFTVLVILFIILKTPALALIASRGWRLFIGQNASLASSSDIYWLGYSYLAFRLIHTIRDRQSGRLPDVALGEYLTYVIFFPSFSVGPIDRVERFIKGLRQLESAYSDDILVGGQRLVVGLFKKFVIADSLAMIALNPLSATQAQSPLGAWVLLYAYAFQIFFDFSGYTDIAIGLAQFLGISLPENFKQPYRKSNLTLFWNSWHITLTQWFRAYFFNPFVRALRKSRKLSAGMMILVSQLVTMSLIGLWHGVMWSFVLWGLWHGIGLFVQNRWSGWAKTRLAGASLSTRTRRILSLLGIALTFNYVALGWVWFVLPNPSQGWQFILLLFGGA